MLIWPEFEDPLFMSARNIRWIVVHCTGTRTNATIAAIQRYWREVLEWRNPGYHYIIDRQGRTIELHPEHLIANGVAGHNSHAIHLSYIGGLNQDNRTPEQRAAMITLVTHLKRKYPNAIIQGHSDFPNVAKACPRFNAIQEYKHIK
jgi:N-acetylmuramoyl-L-alanine amidase